MRSSSLQRLTWRFTLAILGVICLLLLIGPAWLPSAWKATKIRWIQSRATSLHETATTHIEAGRFDDAIDCLTRAIGLDAGDQSLAARVLRRHCFVASGRLRQALDDANYLVDEFHMLPNQYVERRRDLGTTGRPSRGNCGLRSCT